jgi:hypothetical protein
MKNSWRMPGPLCPSDISPKYDDENLGGAFIGQIVGFGEGECNIGMNILIFAQVEIVPPPFSSRCFSRGANGGG